MSDYIRTTRECPVNQIHPDLSKAILEYFQTHQLGDVEARLFLCCETISEKKNPGTLATLLNGDMDNLIHLAIVLTPEWLIWARNGDHSGTIVTGAKLTVIYVKAFVTRRSKDMELEVSGFIADTKEYVRGNLRMGPELAAQTFCETVVQANLKANPPAKRSYPRWLGG